MGVPWLGARACVCLYVRVCEDAYRMADFLIYGCERVRVMTMMSTTMGTTMMATMDDDVCVSVVSGGGGVTKLAVYETVAAGGCDDVPGGAAHHKLANADIGIGWCKLVAM